MKKHLALGIAGASAALIGGWRLINEMVNRDGETDSVTVAPGVPAESVSEPRSPATEPAGPVETAKPTVPPISKGSSKAELYEIAQKLGIDGRSKMTKDELLKAIRQAG